MEGKVLTTFEKDAGRLRLTYRRDFGESMAVGVWCRAGWNDACEYRENRMSIEEAHDLHYMLGRLIAQYETVSN